MNVKGAALRHKFKLLTGAGILSGVVGVGGAFLSGITGEGESLPQIPSLLEEVQDLSEDLSYEDTEQILSDDEDQMSSSAPSMSVLSKMDPVGGDKSSGSSEGSSSREPAEEPSPASGNLPANVSGDKKGKNLTEQVGNINAKIETNEEEVNRVRGEIRNTWKSHLISENAEDGVWQGRADDLVKKYGGFWNMAVIHRGLFNHRREKLFHSQAFWDTWPKQRTNDSWKQLKETCTKHYGININNIPTDKTGVASDI